MRKILSFLLLGDIGNIINDIAQKYNESLNVSYIRKCKKLHLKAKKAERDINFLLNCKTQQVFLKFLCFSIPQASNVDITAIHKRLLKS